jgi:hypothetical protein
MPAKNVIGGWHVEREEDRMRGIRLVGSAEIAFTIVCLTNTIKVPPAHADQLKIGVDKPFVNLSEGSGDFVKFTVTNISGGVLGVVGPTDITANFIKASDNDATHFGGADVDSAGAGLSVTLPNTCFGLLMNTKTCTFSEFISTDAADPNGGDSDSGVTEITTLFGFRAPSAPALTSVPAPAVDVKVTDTPIPEPSTLLLLTTGLAGVIGLRRKRLFKHTSIPRNFRLASPRIADPPVRLKV